MSGTYFITITYQTNLIFKGSFIVGITKLPNIIAFYEEGNPDNILASPGSWVDSDNAFVSNSYPFSPNGVSITTMSRLAGDYGINTTDHTYNIYSNFLYDQYNRSITLVRNFPQYADYTVITVTGGPLVQPFPRDTSIPPPCFYNMQGLPMYLNQNKLYKNYYTDWQQFPYLTIYADNIYPVAALLPYDVENVPLPPLLANLSQGQARQYEAQLALFRKVYEHNYNAYMAYISQPPGSSGGPRYYTFADYKELNNYKAGLQLVNRIYPFDLMSNAIDILYGIPLRWVVPFPM
jgi:hypothetical protein